MITVYKWKYIFLYFLFPLLSWTCWHLVAKASNSGWDRISIIDMLKYIYILHIYLYYIYIVYIYIYIVYITFLLNCITLKFSHMLVVFFNQHMVHVESASPSEALWPPAVGFTGVAHVQPQGSDYLKADLTKIRISQLVDFLGSFELFDQQWYDHVFCFFGWLWWFQLFVWSQNWTYLDNL